MIERSRYKWYLVALLFTNAALNYADRTAASSVFPLLQRDLGMTDLGLAAVGSFFLWSYAAASPFAGYISDRLARGRMIALSLAAWSLVTLVSGMVHSSTQLLIARLFLGAAESLYIPAAMALIAEYHPVATRGTAMGLHSAGLTLGLVAGGTLSGYLGEHYGWRAPFLVLGAIGFVMSGISLAVLPAKRSIQPSASNRNENGSQSMLHSVGFLVRVPSYVLLVSAHTMIALGSWMFANWLPLFFHDTFHMTLAAAAFAGTFWLQVAATVGTVAGGWVSDQIARRSITRRMLWQSGCYFAAAPLLLAFLWPLSAAMIGGFVFAFALVRGLGSNENPVICDLLPSRYHSTALGLLNMSNCFVGGIGIFLAGVLKKQFGLSGVFAGVSLAVVMAGLLLMIAYRHFLVRDFQRVSPNAEAKRAAPIAVAVPGQSM